MSASGTNAPYPKGSEKMKCPQGLPTAKIGSGASGGAKPIPSNKPGMGSVGGKPHGKNK